MIGLNFMYEEVRLVISSFWRMKIMYKENKENLTELELRKLYSEAGEIKKHYLVMFSILLEAGRRQK